MKILYQPTQDTPGDWLECDSSEWAGLGSFAVHALCVQGVVFDGGDHYAVEDVSPGIVRVVMWADDPSDWPLGQRWARVVTFHNLAPDLQPEYGGAINTRIEQSIYADRDISADVFVPAYRGVRGVNVVPFARFDPRRVSPRNGLWVPDDQHEAHIAARSARSWREWTDGVDPSLIGPDGKLVDQRKSGLWVKPRGTQTYYHRDTDRAVSFTNCDHENAFETSTGSPVTEQDSGIGTAGTNSFSATTPANKPGQATWPTTGTYRYQIDASSVSVDITFGLLTQGVAGTDGGFHRVTANLASSQVKIAQSQSAFSGSGLHLASVTDPNFNGSSPLASDVFAIVVSAVKTSGHGNSQLTLQLNETDDYADGPWDEYVEAADPLFFGTNF